jgi:hypothetical protein
MRRNPIAVGVLLALMAQGPALAGSNTVPATRLGRVVIPIGPNDLKPTECASITVTKLFVGSGANFNGSTSGDLMLGTAGGEQLSGGSGTDCLVGGGGNDTLVGGADADVCIGGPGTDSFTSACETQYQ